MFARAGSSLTIMTHFGGRGRCSWRDVRYHHAKLVQAWLARPGCRIKLHFIPTDCPHLDPIERLRGFMQNHITHNGATKPSGNSPTRFGHSCVRSCPETRAFAAIK